MAMVFLVTKAELDRLARTLDPDVLAYDRKAGLWEGVDDAEVLRKLVKRWIEHVSRPMRPSE